MSTYNFDYFLWVTGVGLQFVLCFVVIRRRLWQRLPLFTTYILLVFAAELARTWGYLHWGANSLSYAKAYWVSQGILVMARCAALVDICRAALRPYRGVWLLLRWGLAGTAAVMLLRAAERTGEVARVSKFVIFLERELEFVVVVMLVVLLAVSRYYGTRLERPFNVIGLGFTLYSSVAIINNSIQVAKLSVPWELFSQVHSVSFLAALAIWIAALWHALPQEALPEMSTAEEYQRGSQSISTSMRQLNTRLAGLMKR
jgi:hypothetical protein